MLRVGLTGGIACGKSTVGRMMEARGAYLIQADRIAHEVMLPGTPVYKEVVSRFGREVVKGEDGIIDRKKLADAAFSGGRIAELNEIVHPTVIRLQEEWMSEVGRKDATGVALVEAALILEAGVGKRFDKIVVVTCREDERTQRFVSRMTGENVAACEENAREDFLRRIAAQMPEPEKVKLADFVVDNSGSLEETQFLVDKLMIELCALAAAT